MSTTQYDLMRRGVAQNPVLIVTTPALNPVINLEQHLIAKLRRSGLMVGLSFEGERLKLTLFGVLTRSATSSFKEFVRQIFESGYYRIKVDLTGVERIDGNGLAVLTWMTVRANEGDGLVLIFNPKAAIRNMMLTVGAHFMLELDDYDLVAS